MRIVGRLCDVRLGSSVWRPLCGVVLSYIYFANLGELLQKVSASTFIKPVYYALRTPVGFSPAAWYGQFDSAEITSGITYVSVGQSRNAPGRS